MNKTLCLIFATIISIIISPCIVFANNKDFWEAAYTPTRIEYLQDRMFSINNYLRTQMPNTKFFLCSVSYNKQTENYNIVCQLDLNNASLDKNMLSLLYLNIKSTFQLALDVCSANVDKSWSKNIPIILYAYNGYNGETIKIDN